jgi:hypothetical protein
MRTVHAAGIATVLMLLSHAACAQSTWLVLQRFGLVGTWAYPCSAAPSTTNWWTTYFQSADGRARRSADRGPSEPKLMVAIDSAEILTSTTMAARFRNDDPNWGQMNGVVVDIIMVKENGRIRTLTSRSMAGQEFIKNGVVVSSNAPAPWLEKCSK